MDSTRHSALQRINDSSEPQRTEILRGVIELIFMRVTERAESAFSNAELDELEQLNQRDAAPGDMLEALRRIVEAHGLDFERIANDAATQVDERLTSRMNELPAGGKHDGNA